MAASEPFAFSGDDRGVLLLHGFTGTPFEMRPLGERLVAAGFTVVAPRLAGHGLTPADLDRATWRDWLGSAAAALAELRARSRTVAVAGLSMGALLALELARGDAGLAAVAAIGTPLWLPWGARVGLPVVRGLRRLLHRPLPPLPKLGHGGDIRDREMGRQNPQLDAFPLVALESLAELAARVRAALPEVTVPLLVAHGAHDHTAAPACAAELYARAGARDRRFLLLPRSYHIATLDVDRDLLADAVTGFFTERSR